MWFDQIEEVLKGYLPYYVLVFLPIFIIVSPANPVLASHEFNVYRMQHFDLHGKPYGCRSAAINLEARSLSTWSTSRHCVVTKFLDLTIEHFNNIKAKAGALIVMVPEKLASLSSDEKEHILHVEKAMLSQETSMPVYFASWSPEFNLVVNEIAERKDTQDLKTSAAAALFSSVAANGYQIVVTAPTPSVSNVKLATFHGHLAGYSTSGTVPTIAVVAHYDSFGVAPELSFGADANGSGIIILLELIRLFSGMYSDPKSRGKYNIMFILNGGGKVNFQGSKKWLEEQLDISDGSLIREAEYVMCLDTLTATDSMYMHVSKPPKEGSAASLLYKELNSVATSQFPNLTVEGVHKKINLADDILAWEHERYSLRRLPGFTLSSIKSYKDLHRSTILDTRDSFDMDRLVHKTKVIVEAVGKHIYGISEGNAFGGSWDVSKEYMDFWLNILTSQARSPQLLSSKDNLLVKAFHDNFNKHLMDVKVTYVVPDKRDPDFQFYGNTGAVMNVYSVKPAVFDLIVTLAILAYLGVVYLFIHFFPHLYTISSVVLQNKKLKSF